MATGHLLTLQMLESGNYDPTQLGAKCDLCVMTKWRDGGPVPPELHDGATIGVVCEAPADKEVVENRPLVGPGGMEFQQSLSSVGVTRTELNLHFAVACRAPENDLDKINLKHQRMNKKRVKNGESALPTVVECCRPRLMNELDSVESVITMGKVAYQSITGQPKSILDIRGGPASGYLDQNLTFGYGTPPDGQQTYPLRILPTISPAFVMRMRRWTKAFRADLSRAHRWFTKGRLGWVEPAITWNPDPADLRAFLSRTDIAYSVDVETTIDDPTVAKLKTVGVGHEHAAMVVTFLSIEGPNGSLVPSPYYTDAELREVREIFAAFFANKDILKVGHNAGYFDQMVIKQHFGTPMVPLLDTILLHRSVESELPHKLAYVASVYTDVVAWKDAHTATEARTDAELARYNGIDCVVTARVEPMLGQAILVRGQQQVVQKDHRVQQVCVGLHENGMLVDRAARDIAATDLLKRIVLHKKAAQEIAGKPELNPNSVAQLRDLLFDQWKLDPVEYTKLGDPSTNDESIRVIRSAIGQHNPTATAFIDELRKYRRVAKEYGTYVRRLIPYGAPLDGNTFQSEEEEEESNRGLIMADGRVRPDYNAHGTTSGRLSSSNPNAQNWPKHLRKLIIPQPGHVIVGADADQLELRIITAIAQIRVYLDAFANKKDPHAMTASLMFGAKFDSLVPKSDLWDKLRKIAKSIKYASFYGSGDETVHGLVTSAEDDNGNLMYPDLTVREVSTLKRNWLKGIPELPKFWDDTMEEFQSAGYVLDPVWGRRRDFLDGEKFNEIINHPIQSAGAHIIHESTFDLLNVIPFFKWGAGTGLIAQVHDALYVEAPCPHDKYEAKDAEFGYCPPKCTCEANRAARDIEAAMNRTVKGLDGLTFSAKAKIGKNWGEV